MISDFLESFLNKNKKAPSELISPHSTIEFHAKGRCSGCRLMHLFSLFFSQQWVLEAINRGGKYCASNTLFLSLILLLWQKKRDLANFFIIQLVGQNFSSLYFFAITRLGRSFKVAIKRLNLMISNLSLVGRIGFLDVIKKLVEQKRIKVANEISLH